MKKSFIVSLLSLAIVSTSHAVEVLECSGEVTGGALFKDIKLEREALNGKVTFKITGTDAWKQSFSITSTEYEDTAVSTNVSMGSMGGSDLDLVYVANKESKQAVILAKAIVDGKAVGTIQFFKLCK